MIALPPLIAHRCGGNHAPENTLAGLRAAAAQGCRAVEFDVMLSADGTPVLIHDETLERTTNGVGLVCETSDAILFSLDAGDGERIPTLAEAAALCRQFGFIANIEIKPALGYEIATAECVARFVANHWQAPSPLLSSFSMEALHAASRLYPTLSYGLLYEKIPANWQTNFAAIGACTLHCDADLLGDAMLAEVIAADVPVLCYTVNDVRQARHLLAAGVTSVFSDCIGLLD